MHSSVVKEVRVHVSLPTVPARVTLWLLEPSGDVSKGNASKNVHVMAESQANVLTLHHPSLGVDDAELQK